MNDQELNTPTTETGGERLSAGSDVDEDDDLAEEDAILYGIRDKLGIAPEPEDQPQTEVKPTPTESVVKTEAVVEQKRESPEEIRKRKKYEFTEVSDGKKTEERRYSRSKQYLGIKDIQVAGPIVRGGQFGTLIPKATVLDGLLNELKRRNQKWTDELSLNQRAIFKKYLTVNLLSEEIMKKSDESQLQVLSRVAEEKMDEFNVVDVSILKYKAHLTYLTQRLENMEQLCDKAFDELKKKYETKLMANKPAPQTAPQAPQQDKPTVTVPAEPKPAQPNQPQTTGAVPEPTLATPPKEQPKTKPAETQPPEAPTDPKTS